ncbi:MAG: hypothetical protein NTV61_05030 [Candidatus Bathyarchaeota archaeon]|nr:hypothetical protein [Candidatus Bathyarchaeota archaeon]
MSLSISENERRVLYLSLFLIILLALVIQLTSDQVYSLLALLFLGVIAVGNIVYLYSRRRK